MKQQHNIFQLNNSCDIEYILQQNIEIKRSSKI